MREAWRGIQQRLRDDAALAAFFATRYPDRPLHHFLGYRVNRPAGDYPYLAVVPSRARFDRFPRQGSAVVSVIVGLHEPDDANGESQGLVRIDEALGLIVPALHGQPLAPGVLFLGAVELTTDLGVTHPYYEGEAALQLSIT